MIGADKVQNEIALLGDLPRQELANRWMAIYGTPPPPGARRVLLERAIAWQLQAAIEGGLSKDIQRRLQRLGSSGNASATSSSAKCGRGGTSSPSLRQRERPFPGTRIIREWHGRTHTVEVTVSGYVWNGENYRSLSEIARLITGTRWSGPRFFGT